MTRRADQFIVIPLLWSLSATADDGSAIGQALMMAGLIYIAVPVCLLGLLGGVVARINYKWSLATALVVPLGWWIAFEMGVAIYSMLILGLLSHTLGYGIGRKAKVVYKEISNTLSAKQAVLWIGGTLLVAVILVVALSGEQKQWMQSGHGDTRYAVDPETFEVRKVRTQNPSVLHNIQIQRPETVLQASEPNSP